MGDRSIDLHGFKRFCPLLVLALVLHGPHIVEPVRDLDKYYAYVLCHGEQHLPQILHLLVFSARILHSCQLGDAFNNIRHSCSKLFGNIRMREIRIFDNIMKQGGDHRILIQTHIICDLSRSHTMGNVI